RQQQYQQQQQPSGNKLCQRNIVWMSLARDTSARDLVAKISCQYMHNVSLATFKLMDKIVSDTGCHTTQKEIESSAVLIQEESSELKSSTTSGLAPSNNELSEPGSKSLPIEQISKVEETSTVPATAILENTGEPEAPKGEDQTAGAIHLGSKRPKESKHGHYGSEQQPKKQKKRLDLVKDTNAPLLKYSTDLRKIKPYFFKYQTFAKGRWLGRPLIEVFNTEFRDRDNDFYERAIKDGRIKINGEPVTKDYIIRNSDIVAHDIHRHEPPVANIPVKVVREEDGVIIVDKPSSIPVHPSGRYRHNTVLHILMKEHGYKDLY
ncbi:hypothetical protein BX616_005636, partial [Lobosporangium transversale]